MTFEQVLCFHVTSLSIVRNFTWAGCITQKYLGVRCITNCDFYIPIILPFTQSSRLLATILPTFLLTILKQIALLLLFFFFNRCNQGKVGAFFPRCCYSHICQWRGIHLFTEMNSWIIWKTQLLSSFHWKKWTNDTNGHVRIVKYYVLNFGFWTQYIGFLKEQGEAKVFAECILICP